MDDGYILISDQITVEVDIIAIILGADESLLKLDNINGFSFERVSLNDFKYKDRILMVNQSINNKYYMSQIQYDLNDIKSASFICLKKTSSFNVKSPEIKPGVTISDKSLELQELEEYKEEQFQLINRIISKLLLLKVADVGIYEVFYEFAYKFLFINSSLKCTIFIDDATTIIKEKWGIDDQNLVKYNEFLLGHNTAYEVIKHIIDSYTYSYKLIDNAKSFEQLITTLEIMFLPSDQRNKKETLSKRIALLLGDSDLEISNIYNNMKSFYRFRSEYTHEGISVNIGDKELKELKELTRQSIMKYINVIESEIVTNPNITFEEVKANLVTSLIAQVSNKINSGVLPS